jgi:glycine cleavage system transcriptional repressor
MEKNNKDFLVISALGPDRIGFADQLSQEILDRQGNIEESKMAVLGGEFAMLVLVSSGHKGSIDTISRELSAFGEREGISVLVKPTTAPRHEREAVPYRLETISLDSPGIVHAVTALCREYGINIEDLETDTSSAPMTGAPMFHMKAIVAIPSSLRIHTLRDRLEELEDERGLDVIFKPLASL